MRQNLQKFLKTFFYILVESDITYLIIIAIRNPDTEEEYRPGLDLIMDSIKIRGFGQ